MGSGNLACFDCILLDYRLPDGTGIDLLHQLRGSAENGSPVVVLAAAGDERVAAESIKAGALDTSYPTAWGAACYYPEYS